LTFTTLFPNRAQPVHGIFVDQRLKQLVDSGKVSAAVVAPVPWFPFAQKIFGRYSHYPRIPTLETRHSLNIHHPRFFIIPKIGMNITPFALYYSSLKYINNHLNADEDFDLIDAHYFYPDGVAAIHLGRTLGKPVVITGRGTDLSLIPNFALARRQITWAARRAAGIVTVSDALKSRVARLGIPESRIVTLRNGVDLEAFRPIDRARARRKLQIPRTMILSVGHLIERKGHDISIGALKELGDVDLLIVGEGPEKERLMTLTHEFGLSERVRFVGQVPQEELPMYYSAAEALVLASSREGWANVLLESMACGTPVVATDIEGNREVIQSPKAGVLVRARTSAGLAGAIQGILADPPSRQETRAYAERFSWEATTEGQLRLFEKILNRGL
jgi:glycosyltransferase involved in cell wall biosynthesis